jgi:hypothetical protein
MMNPYYGEMFSDHYKTQLKKEHIYGIEPYPPKHIYGGKEVQKAVK